MKNNFYLWMLAAILIISGNMVLTACSNSDDPVTPGKAGPGPLAGALSGMWYDIYDAEGTAQRDNGDGTTVNYDAVIEIYRFEENGSGTFNRCFFGDDELTARLVHGNAGYGDFTYSSKADGTVNMALKNNWKQTYPQAWSVTYADEAITAKGVDGRKLTLVKADEEMKAVLSAILEENGGKGSKYDIEKYKPKGVDNSQWMKTLADSRLVADLSLPGSHDACTAEGWYTELLAPVYELSAKCNDLTIKEQLKIGMRVFDLRPELVVVNKGCELRCSHGIAYTKMLVADFFRTLQTFLTENPSEFCVITVDLSATYDMKTWGKDFTALLNSTEFAGLFADFKSRLTVGEMRGHVLILARKQYAEKPIGGYCYGWVYDLELEKQTKGYILSADDSKTPLWVQDYWGKPTRDGKDEAVVRMLEAAAARDMTVARPAWVINYPSAYFTLPLSDSYRENATFANVVTANWLDSHDGSVGIIYMDFGGMDNSVSYNGEVLYATAGMRLVNAVIKQNAVKP